MPFLKVDEAFAANKEAYLNYTTTSILADPEVRQEWIRL